MKIANVMTNGMTNGKAILAKMAALGLLAGAVVMAAPAQAQVGFGVHFGGPRVGVGIYARPAYGPRYYAPPVVYGPSVYARPYGYHEYGYRHEYYRDGRRYWR